MPDSHLYGDENANTLGNISQHIPMCLPNMKKMGLGNILYINGTAPVSEPIAAFGKMAEASAGKDTTTGHWEMAGLQLEKAFPSYTQEGFPLDVQEKFEKLINKKVIWKASYSGTEILKDHGLKHLETGFPIVYTSADSVFQLAAHEELFEVTTAKGFFKGLDAVYECCRIAREEVLTGEHAVGRVIARPFTGDAPDNFKRTANRHDYALIPMKPTVLDNLSSAGYDVIGIGKIKDIFAGSGITEFTYNAGIKTPAVSASGTVSDIERTDISGINNTIEYLKKDFTGLLFTNLVDFDMHFGHRNDIAGYRENLIRFDHRLPDILKELREDDILIITADHGCDPTFKGTDHSREYVPLLVYGKKVKPCDLGIRRSFADIAATIAEFFNIKPTEYGESFLSSIL
jgi:phosphopentomutase